MSVVIRDGADIRACLWRSVTVRDPRVSVAIRDSLESVVSVVIRGGLEWCPLAIRDGSGIRGVCGDP